MISYSVIIPVHNEEANLERFVLNFLDNIGSLKRGLKEILLIENGSTDESFKVCMELSRRFPDIIITHNVSKASYGEAVKSGMLAAKGDAVSILECDYLDVDFLARSVALIEEDKADFVLASKRHPNSIDKRPLKRRLLTYLFNLFLEILFRFPIKDTHGLKTIKTGLAVTLCNIAITGGEVFQTEVVMLAYKLGYRVVETPIHIYEKRSSPVSVTRRIPQVINIYARLKQSLDRFSD